LLPGGGAGATDQDVEHLTTGGTQRGELGQVERVWQPHRAPAAAKEWCQALRGALAGTVRVEHAVYGQSLAESGQPFRWEMRAADRESWQPPAESGEQVKRPLDPEE